MNLTKFDGHTPGPWHADYRRFNEVHTADGLVVATCKKLTSLVAVRSTANLIAAAPDLLAEVRRLTAEADAMRRERDTACATLTRTGWEYIPDGIFGPVWKPPVNVAMAKMRRERDDAREERDELARRNAELAARLAEIEAQRASQPACDWPGKCAHKRPASAAAPEQAEQDAAKRAVRAAVDTKEGENRMTYIEMPRNVLPNGLILLQQSPDCAARLDPAARDHGWLYTRGADGQWVTMRKLTPDEIETAYDQSADMRVIVGVKVRYA